MLLRGKKRSYIASFLLVYVFVDCFLSVLLSIISIVLFRFDFLKENLCPFSTFVIVGFMILDIAECTLFPYLIYCVTKKNTIFGEEKGK